MSIASEFKSFALKGNVIDLAVAVVIGKAFTDIVNALVAGVLMPVIGALLPGDKSWETWEVTALRIKLGLVLATIINFVITALVLFAVVVKLMGKLKKKEPAAPPATRACPECLENVPIAARRCRACASVLPAAA